jgi:hypothetical protein
MKCFAVPRGFPFFEGPSPNGRAKATPTWNGNHGGKAGVKELGIFGIQPL